jgi:hypothetical protein
MVRYFCIAQKQKGVADAMIEAGGGERKKTPILCYNANHEGTY